MITSKASYNNDLVSSLKLVERLAIIFSTSPFPLDFVGDKFTYNNNVYYFPKVVILKVDILYTYIFPYLCKNNTDLYIEVIMNLCSSSCKYMYILFR